MCTSFAVILKTVLLGKVGVECTIFLSVLDLVLCMILDAVRLALLG